MKTPERINVKAKLLSGDGIERSLDRDALRDINTPQDLLTLMEKAGPLTPIEMVVRNGIMQLAGDTQYPVSTRVDFVDRANRAGADDRLSGLYDTPASAATATFIKPQTVGYKS